MGPCSTSCGAHVPSPAGSTRRMQFLMFRSGFSMIFEAQLYIEPWCGAVDKREWSIPSHGNTVKRDGSFGWAGMLGWKLTIKPLQLSLTHPVYSRQWEKLFLMVIAPSHSSSPHLSPGAQSSKLGTSSTTPSASCAMTAAST